MQAQEQYRYVFHYTVLNNNKNALRNNSRNLSTTAFQIVI